MDGPLADSASWTCRIGVNNLRAPCPEQQNAGPRLPRSPRKLDAVQLLEGPTGENQQARLGPRFFGNAPRLARGWSQAELSRLHRTAIGPVERGERKVSILNLRRIALACGSA